MHTCCAWNRSPPTSIATSPFCMALTSDAIFSESDQIDLALRSTSMGLKMSSAIQSSAAYRPSRAVSQAIYSSLLNLIVQAIAAVYTTRRASQRAFQSRPGPCRTTGPSPSHVPEDPKRAAKRGALGGQEVGLGWSAPPFWLVQRGTTEGVVCTHREKTQTAKHCIVEVQTAVSMEVHQSHEKKKGPPG